MNTADEVFTITTDTTPTDTANSTYTFDMLQPIGNGSRTNFSDFADVPAGNYAWFSLPFVGGTPNAGNSVLFTGAIPGTDTVNPSSIGVGTDAQLVAPAKSSAPAGAVRIDFVSGVGPEGSAFIKKDLSSLSTLSYSDHYEVNDSGFTLAQVKPAHQPVDIRLDAYQIASGGFSGGTFPTDSGSSSTQEKITEVKIATFDSMGNETVLADFTASGSKTFTNGGVTQTVAAEFGAAKAGPTDANGVDVLGVQQVPGEYVLASTATGFDRLLATNIGNSYGNGVAFDMGAVSAGTFQAGQGVNMAFNLALQDYDAYHSGLNGSLTEAGTGTLKVNLTAPAQF